MWFSVRMHVLKDVSACHHMSMQREIADVIKYILILNDKANSDFVSVSVKIIML